MAVYIVENTLKPLSLVNTMSSTTNVQNLLTNVFRPRYTYNTLTSNYQTKLEIANVDTVSANTVTAYAANIGDASGNVYVGVGAGNDRSMLTASSNTTDTFLGTGAGSATCNVKNSVFLGYRAGASVSNASNSISIGANTPNGGNSNIYIGCATGIATGSNNIFLGPGITNGGVSVSNTLLVGSGTKTAIIGDLTNNRVGINMSTMSDPSTNIVFDVNGYSRISGPSSNGGLGININPGVYTLDVNGNMRVSDGWGSLILTHDANSNASLTFSNVRSANCNATIQSTTGFTSSSNTIRITNGSSSTIGVLKKGTIIVHATDSIASSSNTVGATIICSEITVPTMYIVARYNGGTAQLLFPPGGNIGLSNQGTTTTYSYSITYFPSP